MNNNENFKWLKGMKYFDALAMMESYKPYYLYPISLNGQDIIKTDDFDPYRIDIKVKHNIIKSVDGCG